MSKYFEKDSERIKNAPWMERGREGKRGRDGGRALDSLPEFLAFGTFWVWTI